ncbi:uncharacterized protein KD926_004780 [Aspergillus affinis]|uniref:uncharacterized protein n=1 Tax=Aspergillus affinis TaxID=1070780 RepID=UPI0022FE366B|nr:uncharacterized protein KD926_004780 [Aspergillus affinis]KAI9042989.1 hypothetical protein KD926_004780 [Aspergillus affinis]
MLAIVRSVLPPTTAIIFRQGNCLDIVPSRFFLVDEPRKFPDLSDGKAPLLQGRKAAPFTQPGLNPRPNGGIMATKKASGEKAGDSDGVDVFAEAGLLIRAGDDAKNDLDPVIGFCFYFHFCFCFCLGGGGV